MLGVIIPTLNAQGVLPDLLRSIGDAPVRIIVSDGGSTDETLGLALEYDARLAVGTAGRGAQLARGAALCGAVSEVSHYLFLHADCRLPKGWADAVQIAMVDENRAHYFRYGPRLRGWRGAWLRAIVGLRCWAWKLPYGDQGLLISRKMYDDLGGFRADMPLFEDVEFVERIAAKYGRKALAPLPLRLSTDAGQHDRHGLWRRGWRNYRLLRAYKAGASVTELEARYNA